MFLLCFTMAVRHRKPEGLVKDQTATDLFATELDVVMYYKTPSTGLRHPSCFSAGIIILTVTM